MSKEEREELLKNFRGLRVADVVDGMDWMMLRDIGLMDRKIRPIWHPVRVFGIAKVLTYIPTNKKIRTMSPKEYDEVARDWYTNLCPIVFEEIVEPGDVIVIDASGIDCGFLGSNSSLAYIAKGAKGLIIDGGCRDVDEVIKEKVPVFAKYISRTMVQGRLEFKSKTEPAICGGVEVRPGDVIVADGDGVIVVPREKALGVAKYARRELEKDKKGRRNLYKTVGLPFDDTV